MSIYEKAQEVKREMESCTNPQRKAELNRQYERLTNYILTGSWASK